jgi:ubiquinone/menaquinone biosynthesis C-methylase UbiE
MTSDRPPAGDDKGRTRHRETTQRSFARQAADFARSPVVTDPTLLARLVEWADPPVDHDVLDVACGPGLVAAAFAPRARRVIGVDLTAVMLAAGVALVAERAAHNVRFVQADVEHLPFAAGVFGRVVSRRAFHHFADPARVLAEMARVCAPGGAIVIEDQALPDDPVVADAMTTIDRLRDPSHTRAVAPHAWASMLGACGLVLERIEVHPRELEVDEWLPRAHPTPEHAARVRALLAAVARGDAPGPPVREVDGGLRLTIDLQILRAACRGRTGMGKRG